MLRGLRQFCLLAGLIGAVGTWAQGHTLTIRAGDQTLALTLADLQAMPSAKVATQDADRGEYDGVPLIDLLKRGGVTFGQTLRGPRLATYVLATGADGYRVVIALPEIDPEFSRNAGAIVAIRQNGRPLTGRDGPLQLVLPGDKRHARWVRSLTSLHVLTAPEVK